MRLIDAEYLIEHVRACMENDRLLKNATKDEILQMIKEVPSAQPELIEKAAYIRGFEQGRTQGIIDSQGGKKGEWIDYSDEGYVECPFCHSATNCDGNKDELHYCFSCGAELRGEQE